MREPNILILLGARQVGKTTLMAALKEMVTQENRKVKAFNLEFIEDLLYFSRKEVELFHEFS